MAALRHLAIDCEFGDSLNVMLRDRLICGINDPRIQRRLLSEAELDFDKALKTALAMEMADRDAEDLKGAGGPGDRAAPEGVHRTAPGGETRGRDTGSCQNCYRCGGNHKATSCRHKETTCPTIVEKGDTFAESAGKDWHRHCQ